ncbi:MAG: SDR family NAD(P)-dependent oxidoreductase, partial [Gemmataceae bacterium]
MNPYDLTGRVALVTGGGVGIGRAVALALAGAGAFVGIHFHESRREAEQTLADLESAGGHGLLLPADLTVEEEAVAIVGQLVRTAKRLDVLVNNAGSAPSRARIEDCP